MTPEERARSLARAKEATKQAFKAMMDAATKTANLFSIVADACTDPTEAEKHRAAAQCWQNSASEAMRRMNEL